MKDTPWTPETVDLMMQLVAQGRSMGEIGIALGRTPEKLSQVPVEKIEAIVRPCGLGPQKAKAIRQLSEILVREHGGRVPTDLEELEKLPGVGHKTAQVVMAQSFGVPSFPVDTHIHRLAQRW